MQVKRAFSCAFSLFCSLSRRYRILHCTLLIQDRPADLSFAGDHGEVRNRFNSVLWSSRLARWCLGTGDTSCLFGCAFAGTFNTFAAGPSRTSLLFFSCCVSLPASAMNDLLRACGIGLPLP
mmetsp:Transcript_57583/g.134936  ORF Transcript_57583/g.134936 Transcript_57583/m.134936 type:complete len:122 (+) Transcript_57583:324-689(+)